MFLRNHCAKSFSLFAFMFSVFFVTSADATQWSVQNNSTSTVVVIASCNGSDKEVEVAPGGTKSGYDTSCEWGQFRYKTMTYLSGNRFTYGTTTTCSSNCCSSSIKDKAAAVLQDSNPKCNVTWSKP